MRQRRSCDVTCGANITARRRLGALTADIRLCGACATCCVRAGARGRAVAGETARGATGGCRAYTLRRSSRACALALRAREVRSVGCFAARRLRRLTGRCDRTCSGVGGLSTAGAA